MFIACLYLMADTFYLLLGADSPSVTPALQRKKTVLFLIDYI